MRILESFWFGGVSLCDQMNSGECGELHRWEETLRANLSPEQWKVYLQLEAAQNRQLADRECQVFASGVRFGVQLLLECLYPETQQQG